LHRGLGGRKNKPAVVFGRKKDKPAVGEGEKTNLPRPFFRPLLRHRNLRISYSSEAVMRLDWQLLLKSPPRSSKVGSALVGKPAMQKGVSGSLVRAAQHNGL